MRLSTDGALTHGGEHIYEFIWQCTVMQRLDDLMAGRYRNECNTENRRGPLKNECHIPKCNHAVVTNVYDSFNQKVENHHCHI